MGLAVVLAAVAAICLATLPADLYPGDPVAMRVSAAALVKHGELGIPARRCEQPDIHDLIVRNYLVRNPESARCHSKYGILTTLLYVPPLWALQASGGLPSAGLSLSELASPSVRLAIGLYQLLFVVLAAFYLHRLAALYARTAIAPAVFVLGVLFATFTWNYARAQTSEIFQLAFFLGFYTHMILWRRSDARADLYAAELWLALLVLTKSFHVVLVPVLAFVALTRTGESAAGLGASMVREVRTRWRFHGLHLVVPMLLLGLLLLGVAAYKLGDPFATGYAEGSNLSRIFSGSLGEGLTGFLFGPQKSVFTHFPLLPLSLLGLIPFARRFPFELALAWALLLLYLLTLSKYLYWDGSWSYGPRYLLLVLPVICLPFVVVVDRIVTDPGRWFLALPVVLGVLGASFVLQWNVNSLNFFSHLYVERLFEVVPSPHTRAFFLNRHVGLVHRDLIAWRDGEAALEPIQVVRPALSTSRQRDLERNLRRMLEPNYRWLR